MSLTPGYAAPERMTGAPVTTSSDIYSLSKILALVLPTDTDADLATIAARATAAERADRYPSADALAGDLPAWRYGFPVHARALAKRYVIGKFLARHRLPVLAASPAVVLLTAALVTTLLANRRAEASRAEAEVRSAQTRSIAKTLLFDVFDQVSRTPGSTQARQVLAQTGATYLNALTAATNALLDVRLEAGCGFLRLAEVVGGGQGQAASRVSATATRYSPGRRRFFSPCTRTAGGDPAMAQLYTALLLEQSGTNLYNHGKTALARQQARQARVIVEPLARTGSQVAGSLVSALQSEGDSYQ